MIALRVLLFNNQLASSINLADADANIFLCLTINLAVCAISNESFLSDDAICSMSSLNILMSGSGTNGLLTKVLFAGIDWLDRKS